MHTESSSPENQIPKSEIEVTGAGGGAADDESINLSTRTTKSESDGLMSRAPPSPPLTYARDLPDMMSTKSTFGTD